MMKLNLNTWSTFGVALLFACSSSKQDGIGSNNPSEASSGNTGANNAHSGGTGPVGISGVFNQGGSAAAASSNVGSGKSGSGSTSTGSTGSGSNGSAATGSGAATSFGGSSVETTAGGSGTVDPPAPEAGSGSTEDPPAPVGDTGDPPVGDTGDPPVGDTGDPPVGDTGDPPVGDTGDPPVGDTPDPPGGDTPDPPEGCTMTEIDKVNVIVFKDATPTGADVEGQMWVGGNATFSGYSVGTRESATDCSYYSLVVGGALSGQVNTNRGKIAVGSMGSGSVSAACGITRNQTVVDFPAIEKKLKGYSAAFRDYPPNGTVSVNSGITLTGTDKSLNVFNVTAAQLTGTGTFKLVVPTTSSVIVNVSGVGPINWSGVGFQLPDGASCRGGTSDWCHNILFNFYEATSITLSGIGVQGSVMAPYAKISGAGGNVDGQLVCDSLTGGIEYHPYFFTGCLLLNRK